MPAAPWSVHPRCCWVPRFLQAFMKRPRRHRAWQQAPPTTSTIACATNKSNGGGGWDSSAGSQPASSTSTPAQAHTLHAHTHAHLSQEDVGGVEVVLLQLVPGFGKPGVRGRKHHACLAQGRSSGRDSSVTVDRLQ